MPAETACTHRLCSACELCGSALHAGRYQTSALGRRPDCSACLQPLPMYGAASPPIRSPPAYQMTARHSYLKFWPNYYSHLIGYTCTRKFNASGAGYRRAPADMRMLASVGGWIVKF